MSAQQSFQRNTTLTVVLHHESLWKVFKDVRGSGVFESETIEEFS